MRRLGLIIAAPFALVGLLAGAVLVAVAGLGVLLYVVGWMVGGSVQWAIESSSQQ